MTQKKTVLLVDDSRFFLELEKSVLGEDNYNFLTAQNGEDALVIAESSLPDVILLDLNMPITNGIEFLNQQQRSETIAEIPVIVVTTRGKDSDIREALQAGARDYITKPIDNLTLIMKVSSLLTSYRIRLSPRREIEMEVTLSDFDQIFTGTTLDIAAGGMLLKTEAQFQRGQIIEIRFKLELNQASRDFQVFGEVVDFDLPSQESDSRALVRAQFINVGWDDFRFLEQFVAADEKAVSSFFTSSPRQRTSTDEEASVAEAPGQNFMTEIGKMVEGLYDIESRCRDYDGNYQTLLTNLREIQKEFSELSSHYRRLKEDYLSSMICSIASRQLSIQRTVSGVISIVSEILENIVGADQFDICFRNPETNEMWSVFTLQSFDMKGLVDQAAAALHKGELYFSAQGISEPRSMQNPEVIIPSHARGELAAVIVIATLLPQKKLLGDFAIRICEVLHRQVGMALFNAILIDDQIIARKEISEFIDRTRDLFQKNHL